MADSDGREAGPRWALWNYETSQWEPVADDRQGEIGWVSLNDEEREAMRGLLRFMAVVRVWGLLANGGELIGAVHVLQGFIVQHMLRRLGGDRWSLWFADQRDVEVNRE